MIKKYPTLKNLITLFFFLFTIITFSQTTGDFRSKATGNWTIVGSWEIYNGNAWINASTYPGQNAGNYDVIIQVGHSITLSSEINTQNFGEFTIAGRLVLNGDNSAGGMDFFINTPKIYVTPSPNGGFIEFNNKLNLRLPETAIFIVTSGGLDVSSGCSANQVIYIGSTAYAKCNGGGSQLPEFTDVMQGGGTLSANPTSNSPICIGNSINLLGGYTGVVGTTTSGGTSGVNYTWEITFPDNTSSSSTNKDLSIPASQIGTYSAKLTCTTYFGAALFSNFKTITVIVNPLPTSPTVGAIAQPTCSLTTGSVFLSGLPAGNWTINPGAITGSASSTTITGLASGTYNYTVTDAGGCSSSASADVVINVNPSNNVWNGSVNTDWNTAGNWCIGVPTIGVANTLNVLIPSGLANYPIIAAGAVAGYVNTIVLENNTTLNVRENSLSVINDLTLNGNSKIDFEGESQLIQSTGSTFSGTGTIEIDQQGTGNSFRYNYWSSPVNSRGATYTIDEVIRDGNGGTLLNKNITFGASHTFAEQNINSSPIQLSTYWMYVLRNSNLGYSAWYRVAQTGEIAVGEGYTMKGSNTAAPEQNYTFVGKPNNGNINLSVDKGYDYLVGNPYPSALDAEQLLLDNAPPPVSLEWPKGTPGKITGTIYFWEHYGGDTHNLAGYQGGYATRNLLDGTAASSGIPAGVSNLGSSVKGKPGRYIAVGQAFFVVGDSINGQIHFNNGQRVFKRESLSEAVFMKSSNNKAKTDVTDHSDLRPKFRIGFDAPKISHRQLLIGVDERATNGVDWGFDAEIYEVFADDMYWMLDGKKYVIQGTNAVGLNSSEFPLGIQLSKTGMVTVKIDALENVDDDTSIYLKDKLTGESFNMMKKPVQLNLTAGEYTDRFVLIFKTQKLVAEEVKAEVLIPAIAQPVTEGIHVFMNKASGELQIKNNGNNEITSVALINSLGQTIKTWNSNFSIRTISLPINAPSGVYVVQINTKNGKTIKKISVE